jgi:uncharacterized damage-inducible protein DinB
MGTGIDKLVEQLMWASNNFAYNLDFIPDEKLEWKPAPTANSALELANHLIGSFVWTTNLITDKKNKPDEAKTKKEAQELIKKKAGEFAKLLKKLTEKELAEKKQMPWGGDMTNEFIAGLGVIDAIHHRGQLLYIQTILGDTQEHHEM